ncbi:Fungal Zn binuclear cluster domain containing protein [Neofusicoccum parvum]|nr:Fungal Zn binuclear cluster domain containing protein [Neofusicoccum parvum]
MSGAPSPAPACDPDQKPPPRRRPPPRLRTKTGCLTCRKRRKKCDERKPSCQTCARLQLDCRWDDPDGPVRDRRLSCHPETPRPSPQPEPTEPEPEPEPAVAAERPADSPAPGSRAVVLRRSPSPPKLLSGLSPFSSERDQSLFTFFNAEILPSLARKHADPVYRDQSTLCSIAYSCPWVMNALLSLACHHRSWLESKNGDPAVPYYAKAVRDLRKNMSTMSATDDSLLVTITFLGLFEELRSDKFSESMVHFNTSSRILRTRMAELVGPSSSISQVVFLRLHAESAMYHLSTRAMFSEKLPDEREWAQLERYLSMRPAPDATDWSESPLLGSIPRLFTLILEITRLSRRVPLDEAHMKKAQRYLDEIQESKIRLQSIKTRVLAANASAEPTLELEIACVPRLYILALEIFLFKIMGPLTTHAINPEIQKRVDEAHVLFHTAPFQSVHDELRPGPNPAYPFTESNCWPLMIIGCAAIQDEHVQTLKKIFLNLWRVRYSGYVRKVIRVVDAGWKSNLRYRNSTRSSSLGENRPPRLREMGPMDGLDILVQGDKLAWDVSS